LRDFAELTEEVLFAFHLQINKLVYLNPAFEKVWNIPRTDISSDLSLLFDTLHPKDRVHVKEYLTSLKRDKKKQNLEFRIVLAGGRQKWVKVNAYFSKKSNNEIIIGIATDITEDKSYSATLHKFADKKNSIL
jgi:PAS domain S-box-containing protein